MEARLRGTFSFSAGVLFALIGFTLSVLATFLRPVLPRSADVKFTTSRRRHTHTTRRTSKIKHRNAPSTGSNSSISSLDLESSNNSSSEVSGCPKSEVKAAVSQRRTLAPPARAGTHSRIESEYIERPDFRRTVNRRRSESTPPSPAPWVSSHSGRPASLKGSDGESDSTPRHTTPTSTFHLARVSSFNNRGRTGLSFLRSKVHKTPSAPNGLAQSAAEQSSPSSLIPPHPAFPVAKRKSQLFAPLLHRRKSQPIHVMELEVELPGKPPSPEQDTALFVESRPSQESHHLAPRRSQTLRTQPYDAPYFFPAPGSVAAETYLPPRRRPIRSTTLHPDEMERRMSQGSALFEPAPSRPASGTFV